MAVCDPVNGMHHLFGDVLAKHVFAPPPRSDIPPSPTRRTWTSCPSSPPSTRANWPGSSSNRSSRARRHALLRPGYLAALRDIADEHGLLLILDEIATGFGRTGELWGCDHAEVTPDIMCLGKALTGGYMTMAATMCTDRVADGISSGEAGVLMHGPTYMANPLAAAVAFASIDLLMSRDWRDEVDTIEAVLTSELDDAADFPGVADVRVLGAIGVIEAREPVDVTSVQEIAMAHGVWLRPFGKLIFTDAPDICTEDDLLHTAAALHAAAESL